VVLLSVPLNPTTVHIANADFFAAMKPGALFVNVGRGGLVDESALLGALASERPGYAWLDVFGSEPLPPEHPFWRHPQITLTPHVSGFSLGNDRRLAELFRANLESYVSGGVLEHEITATDLVGLPAPAR
jgi:phosphoglycerate dehydrogenase-like enzyme